MQSTPLRASPAAALPARPEAVNQPQVMEGPAGVLRCPAPGTLVQRPAGHIQSGAGPLGNNVQNPAQRLEIWTETPILPKPSFS